MSPLVELPLLRQMTHRQLAEYYGDLAEEHEADAATFREAEAREEALAVLDERTYPRIVDHA